MTDTNNTPVVPTPTPETVHDDFFGGPVEAIETLTAPAPFSKEEEIMEEEEHTPAEENIPEEVEETSDDGLDLEPLPELADEPREEDIDPEEVSSPEEQVEEEIIEEEEIVPEVENADEEEAVHVREEEPEDAPVGSALLQKFLELFRITQEAYAVKADDETLDIL
jgi:hypothetical protein